MKNISKKIGIVLGIILLNLFIFIGILAVIINGDKISKNTYINNINIGELTKAQASEKLKNIYNVEVIKFKYNDIEYTLSPKAIDFSYDIDKSVEQAYNLNRNGSFIDNLKKTINSFVGNKNIFKLSINYNKEKLNSYIEDLSKDINVSMKNASIEIKNSNIKIHEDEEGINLEVDKTLNNAIKELEKGNKTIELVVQKIQPDIKEENLQKVDTILGTYSTKFDSSIAGRSHNVTLAAKSTSDVLLMPGESFSYNEYTGPRTVSNGYKNAPVIVQGVVQEGVGGGVCQVSSTLYNSVLYAGLEIESIKNHSIPSSYVAKGRDATVSYGSIDFIFKNNLKYPVYIKNSVYGNTLTCTIYGSSEDKQKIEISTNIDSVSEAPIKKVDDPTLLKGEEKKLESGRNGYTVSTYRIYKDNNGKILKKEKVYVSYYPKKQEVVAVGTKENTIVEEQPTTPVIEEQPILPEEETPSQDVDSTDDIIVDPIDPTQPSEEEQSTTNS